MPAFMKFSSIFLLLLVSYSCNKYEDDLYHRTDCIEVTKKSNWIQKPFNSNYSIMYPDTYDSISEYLLPWNKFELRREDEKVVLDGGFCDPTALPCHVYDYFGESLDTEKDSIGIDLENSKYLNIKKTFCQDGMAIAYFYFNESMSGNFRNAFGVLFLIDKDDFTFRRAGVISFAKSEKQEIFDILETLNFK